MPDKLAKARDPFTLLPAEVTQMMVLDLSNFEDLKPLSQTSRELHAIVHENLAYIFRKMASKILGSVHLPLQLLADQEGISKPIHVSEVKMEVLDHTLVNAQALAIWTVEYQPSPVFDRIWVISGSNLTLIGPIVQDLTTLVNYLLNDFRAAGTTYPGITSLREQDPSQITPGLMQHVATQAFQPLGYNLYHRGPETRRLVRALYQAWSLSLLGRTDAVLRYHSMTLKDLFLVSEVFAAFREPLARLLCVRPRAHRRPTDTQRIDTALSDATFATMERFEFVHREMFRRREAVEPGFRDGLQMQLDGLRELWKTENQAGFRAAVTQDLYWAGQGIMNPASVEGVWEDDDDDDDDNDE